MEFEVGERSRPNSQSQDQLQGGMLTDPDMLPIMVIDPPSGMSLAASRAQNQVPFDQLHYYCVGVRRPTHDVDVEQLANFVGRVLVGDKVLDNASSSHTGLPFQRHFNPAFLLLPDRLPFRMSDPQLLRLSCPIPSWCSLYTILPIYACHARIPSYSSKE